MSLLRNTAYLKAWNAIGRQIRTSVFLLTTLARAERSANDRSWHKAVEANRAGMSAAGES
jgi:hypothetical protein